MDHQLVIRVKKTPLARKVARGVVEPIAFIFIYPNVLVSLGGNG
jgi:hypothetical protein